MKRFFTLGLTLAVLILSFVGTYPATAQEQSEALSISAGSFHSVLPEVLGEPHEVDAFFLDETAVTNSEFLEFLKENKRWRKSEIPTLYAEARYLDHWISDLDFGDSEKADRPVTRVSWYAANAYCGWKGGRLPTLNEWEYAAQAMSFESPEDADQFSHELIGWYSAVDTHQKEQVGSTGIVTNHGVRDLFGLIMEWVEDFNPPIASDISLDCGTIGRMQGNSTLYGYAMSIRYITRMSFKPTSTTGMLGFRCAYDQPQTEMDDRNTSKASIKQTN
jgi:formylglycine-generating enzyme required for sulfatase activity